jgi:HPt (histidine-containing phosphotransfer) domain-containing protein
VINWERVEELRDEIGMDGFAEVVALFLDEADGAVVRLAAGAPAGLAEDLHFLKGAALNLGLAQLADLCQQGERAAARGEGGAVDVDDVRASYAQSRTALLAGLASRSAA